MNCPECGERLADDARFCSACGRRSTSGVMQPPPLRGSRQTAPPPARETPQPAPVPPRAPAARSPAAPEAPRERSAADKVAPAALVGLGVLIGAAAIWSAKRDHAVAQAEAARRMTLATAPLATTTQETAPGDAAFSTRQALQSLYGTYDPHLDGVFWTVTGAPPEWAEWNGRPVFIKPLLSRSDDSGSRHVLVTNSVEIRDGLVVKQGAGCPACKSLLGAALFERRGDEWVLASELRFMRVEGAWGAPPRVEVDFPGKGGVEVRVESASAEHGSGRKPVHVVILQDRRPDAVVPAVDTTAATSSATPRGPDKREAASGVQPGDATVRNLVSAAVEGDDERLQAIRDKLKRQQRPRGDRVVARTLNERGLAFIRDHRYSVAASLFRQAHEADGADPEIRENLGYALLKAGKLAEAEAALLAALETGPDRATAWGSLGFVYAKQGKREHALALLRAAHRVAANPKQVLDTYARQAETEEDPRIRATLAEAVTRLSSAR